MSRFSKWFKRKKKEEEEDVAEEPHISIDEQGSSRFLVDEPTMTREEEEKFIDKAATRIVDMGMDFPAIVLLESSKPFAFLGGQLFYMITPFLGAFNLEQSGMRYKNFFEKPENIERLLKRIEELSKSRKK